MSRIVLDGCTITGSGNAVTVNTNPKRTEEVTVVIKNMPVVMGDIVVNNANVEIENVGVIRGNAGGITVLADDTKQGTYSLSIIGKTQVLGSSLSLQATNYILDIRNTEFINDTTINRCVGKFVNTTFITPFGATASVLTFDACNFLSDCNASSSVLTLNACSALAVLGINSSVVNANYGDASINVAIGSVTMDTTSTFELKSGHMRYGLIATNGSTIRASSSRLGNAHTLTNLSNMELFSCMGGTDLYASNDCVVTMHDSFLGTYSGRFGGAIMPATSDISLTSINATQMDGTITNGFTTVNAPNQISTSYGYTWSTGSWTQNIQGNQSVITVGDLSISATGTYTVVGSQGIGFSTNSTPTPGTGQIVLAAGSATFTIEADAIFTASSLTTTIPTITFNATSVTI